MESWLSGSPPANQDPEKKSQRGGGRSDRTRAATAALPRYRDRQDPLRAVRRPVRGLNRTALRLATAEELPVPRRARVAPRLRFGGLRGGAKRCLRRAGGGQLGQLGQPRD